MTGNARILLNIAATYGRSLYALALGLFTARWALEALGRVDYGLMGVVGGLAAFISFLNSLLGLSVGRFYAVSVGRESVAEDKEAALAESREWFTTAVVLHTSVPLLLLAAGYPAGIWAVRNFLTIPPDRVEDCVWVFRFVCASTFVSMVCVPVQTMYRAKQLIAELTVYSFATATIKAAILFYMVNHPGVWLATYMFWLCLLGVVPQGIIAVHGLWMFPECRWRWTPGGMGPKFRQLGHFAGWQLFGKLGALLRGQGIQILLNKFFGPEANAAMSVANQVNAHTQTLSISMVGAFQPAITQAYGAGDLDRMRTLAYRTCKLSMLFVLVFALPCWLELKEILFLWLESPPQYVYGLCLCMFAVTVIDQSSVGHMLAVSARGKIAAYQAVLGGVLLLTLPLAWLFLAMGCRVYSVGVALLATTAACAWGRVAFARHLVGMSVGHWLRRILLPVAGAAAVSFAAGCLPRLWMGPSFARVVAAAAACEPLFLALAWFAVLDAGEKVYVADRLAKLRNGILGKKTA